MNTKTAVMETQTETEQKDEASLDQKVAKVRELYADAPELGKVALENSLEDLKQEIGVAPRAQSAGRVGARQGKVSELTLIIPLAEGGATRLRGLLQLLGGNFKAADKLGTVHDMRFVFLDNDKTLLFATAYDGEWDAYVDDFATKVADALDVLFCNVVGWPGIRSPEIKDWIEQHQITAESWYVANPNLTATETRHLDRVGNALEDFLDKIQ
jgi:hypothetical protein